MAFRKYTNSRQVVRTKGGSGKRVIIACLVVILLIGTNATLFLWQQRLVREAKQQSSEQERKNEQLEEQIKELQEARDNELSLQSSQAEDSARLTASTLQGILTDKNFAALEPYLAEQVSFILAASEGMGVQTPAQAIDNLVVLDAATAPWNFTVSPTTITDWRSGDYKQYFPEGVVTGVSANGYVIAVQLNNSGKVMTIFISPNVDVL